VHHQISTPVPGTAWADGTWSLRIYIYTEVHKSTHTHTHTHTHTQPLPHREGGTSRSKGIVRREQLSVDGPVHVHKHGAASFKTPPEEEEEEEEEH